MRRKKLVLEEDNEGKEIEKLTMNSLRSLNWVVGIAMASIFAVASTGLAAGIPEAVGHPVKSREEAERLPVGSKVTPLQLIRRRLFCLGLSQRPNMSVLAAEGI